MIDTSWNRNQLDLDPWPSLTILDHPWPIPISSILAAQTPTNMDGQSPVIFPMRRSRQWHALFVSMFWWELPTGCPNKHPKNKVPWEVPPSGFAGSQRYSKSTGLPTSVSLWEDHKLWINHDRSIILGQTYHLWLLYLSNPYWTPHFINITSSWGIYIQYTFYIISYQLQWELSMIFHDVPHPRHFVTSETMDPTMMFHMFHMFHIQAACDDCDASRAPPHRPGENRLEDTGGL